MGNVQCQYMPIALLLVNPYGVVIDVHHYLVGHKFSTRFPPPWGGLQVDPTAQHFAFSIRTQRVRFRRFRIHKYPQAPRWAISTQNTTVTTGRCAPFKAHHVSKLGVSKLSRSLSVVKICEGHTGRLALRVSDFFRHTKELHLNSSS